jgi:hypothetical protein
VATAVDEGGQAWEVQQWRYVAVEDVGAAEQADVLKAGQAAYGCQ